MQRQAGQSRRLVGCNGASGGERWHKAAPTSCDVLFQVLIGCSQAPAVHFFPLGREGDMGSLTLGTWTWRGCVGLEDKASLLCSMGQGPRNNATLKCRDEDARCPPLPPKEEGVSSAAVPCSCSLSPRAAGSCSRMQSVGRRTVRIDEQKAPQLRGFETCSPRLSPGSSPDEMGDTTVRIQIDIRRN